MARGWRRGTATAVRPTVVLAGEVFDPCDAALLNLLAHIAKLVAVLPSELSDLILDACIDLAREVAGCVRLLAAELSHRRLHSLVDLDAEVTKFICSTRTAGSAGRLVM